MPQLHSHRMHAVDFHSAGRSVAAWALIEDPPHVEVSFGYRMVYFVYHDVNRAILRDQVEAPLSALLPRRARPRGDRREVGAARGARSAGGAAPLQRPAPVVDRDHAEGPERSP